MQQREIERPTRIDELSEAIKRSRATPLSHFYKNRYAQDWHTMRFTEQEKEEIAQVIRNSALVERVIDLTNKRKIEWTVPSRQNINGAYAKNALGKSGDYTLVLSQIAETAHQDASGRTPEDPRAKVVHQLWISSDSEDLFIASQLNRGSPNLNSSTPEGWDKLTFSLDKLYKKVVAENLK